ncbi:MAG: hypothetical protein Q9180_008966, partial [Flavoplaca navasiana]
MARLLRSWAVMKRAVMWVLNWMQQPASLITRERGKDKNLTMETRSPHLFLRCLLGPLADFDSNGSFTKKNIGVVQYEIGKYHEYLRDFFSTYSQLILGGDAPFDSSAISPASSSAKGVAIGPHNGVRASNPRLCFSARSTIYLYDVLIGANIIHSVIFASGLRGPMREALT